ncbi:hypothetical protein ACFFIR_16695, partial [Microbacterium arthrosphaerae]
ERRADTIDEHRSEAETLRAQQAETLRKADDVDPYTGDDARDASDARRTGDDRATTHDADAVDDRRTVDGRATVRDTDAVDDRRAAREANTTDDRATVRDTDRDGVPDEQITRPPAPPRTDRA